MSTYSVHNYYKNSTPELVLTGVTLDEARAYCQQSNAKGDGWFAGFLEDPEQPKKFLVRVTELINHDYEIEANSREEAIAIYDSYDQEQLTNLDSDGCSEWDRPWDVEELSN